ncbi:MAG: VWA domain-containing protein [Acidobacteriota bacterium]
MNRKNRQSTSFEAPLSVRRRTLAGILCGLLAFASFAQDDDPLPQIFDEMIEVRVVNLEVVVTDARGERVQGLTADDFELYVDGRRQGVDYFSEIRFGRAEESSEDVEVLPGLDAGSAVGTNYLVYVDDNHTLWHVRKPLIESLIEDLGFMRGADRMAVVAHRGTRLEMLSSWTSDQRVLERALRRLLDKNDFGGALKSPLRTARVAETRRAAARGLRDADDDGSRGFAGNSALTESQELAESGLQNFRSFAAREAEIDLDLAVAGVVATLRSFAEPEGRKVMMLLAGDWPIGAFRGDSLAYTNDLEITGPMVETANLLGYTLYPLYSSKTTDVWRGATLNRFADLSGGRTLYEGGSAFETVVEDTSSYYWLGFSPTMAGDDARHEIEVRVKRPGVQVRSRDGYVDMSRSAQLTMMAQSALFFDPKSGPSPVKLVFGEPKRWRLRKMKVPVTVYIPLDEVTTIPVRGENVAQLELRMAIVDQNGQQARIPTLPVTLRGEQREGDYFLYELDLELRRRPHEIVFAVHDPVSGKTMNARATISLRTGGVTPEEQIAKADDPKVD